MNKNVFYIYNDYLDEILNGKIEKIDPMSNFKVKSDNQDSEKAAHALSMILVFKLVNRLNELYKKHEEQGTVQEWYPKADNMILFLEKSYSPIVALMGIHMAITHPYCLPFHNAHMPGHKDYFSRNYKMFDGIMSLPTSV